MKARRALGVSTFFFAFLHAYFGFFGELGGFEGLGFLSDKYILAISLSSIALLILFLMAATSFDWMIGKMTFPKWKLLHRFVYLAALLSVIHGLILGSDFTNFSGVVPKVFFAGLVILLGLETVRFDRFLQTHIARWPKLYISFSILLVLVGAVTALLYSSPNTDTSSPFNVHSAHIQLAQQAQQGFTGFNTNLGNIPALNGDRTKRFTVSFLHPDVVQPNQDATLKFQIFDASSGNPINFFLTLYAYPMHLMIVDSQLSYFTHIHPTQQANEFVITTQFPKPGFYHLYVQFQPLGGIEQQMAFTLPVGIGANDTPLPATQSADTNFTKTFDAYEVSLDTHGGLKAEDMALGKDTMSFTMRDAKTKQPITNLKPFMASFGHLTMINEKTYDFIHVHPNNLTAPPPDANGGPTVDFLPIGIYGPFKPGIYRAFGEFSTKVGTDFDTDFTIEVK